MTKHSKCSASAYFVAALTLSACNGRLPPASGSETQAESYATNSDEAPPPDGVHPPPPDPFASARLRMVADQIRARGIRDPRVLAAMERVPRHLFVPEDRRSEAYADYPVEIGHDQTISQPYIVALMSELAEVKPGDRVLEVGTGCGYQAAVLAELGAEVYSIEIIKALADGARKRLDALGYRVHVRHGDGYRGWPEHAPFDAVVVTAAPPEVPEPLRQQLVVGGRLVIPVGDNIQSLVTETRTERGFDRETVAGVRFVPMTGEARSRTGP